MGSKGHHTLMKCWEINQEYSCPMSNYIGQTIQYNLFDRLSKYLILIIL